MSTAIGNLPDPITYNNSTNDNSMTTIVDDINNYDYAKAFEALNKEQLHVLFDKLDGKNCIDHLLEDRFNEELRRLFDKIIALAKQDGYYSGKLFQEMNLFQYTLEKRNEAFFEHFVNNHFEHLTPQGIIKCLRFCSENNLVRSCQALIIKLPENKRSEFITSASVESPSALQISINLRRLSIFEIFVKHVRSSYQTDLLHVLIENDLPDFLEAAWRHRQVDIMRIIDYRDTNQCTALHVAAKKCHETCVKKLLSYGADYGLSSYGKTAYEMVPYRFPFHIRSKVSSILKDASYGLFEVEEVLRDSSKIVERRRQGLFKCCQEGNIRKAIDLINEYKIDPDEIGIAGNTPLICFIKYGNVYKNMGIIRRFLDQHMAITNDNLQGKIDINRQNCYGETALTLAAEKGETEVIKLFLTNPLLNYKHANQGERTIRALIGSSYGSPTAKKVAAIAAVFFGTVLLGAAMRKADGKEFEFIDSLAVGFISLIKLLYFQLI